MIGNSVTIGKSVPSLAAWAFESCTSLTSVYFKGNAPSSDWSMFDGDTDATVYYLSGTTGWDEFSANTGLPIVEYPSPRSLSSLP
jgi:hypothetical protein